MKKMKTFAAFFLSLLFGLGAVGCGNNGTFNPNAETGEILIRIVDKGYGTEWLDMIAEAYMESNEDCTVKIIPTQDSAALASRAQSASNDADIIISTDPLWGLQFDNYLYDISPVYDSVQEGYSLPLKDRMNQSFREYFETKEGKFYQMSWVEAYSGFLYNKTVLDEVYGEGNYTIPRTTVEFLEMCKDLSTKGIAPIALSTSMSYYDLIKYTWFAQYLGLEKYNNLLRGYYENESGEYVACTTVEQFKKMIDAEGRIKVYETIFELLGNYAHPESERMSFTDSQNAFLGLGYGDNRTKCAFYLIGDWFQSEMAASLQSSGADVRYMKTLVFSDMTDQMDETLTDEQLSALIGAIDEGKTPAEAGVSEETYARVAEARYMSYSPGINHVMAVPKLRSGGGRYNLAMKFLKYMVSDEAQAIYIQAQNGLVMPYGYTLSDAEEDYGLTFNEYVKSIAAAKGENLQLVHRGENNLFARSFSLFTGYIENVAVKGAGTPASSIAATDSTYNPENCIALIS